jgi:hypothetical protein
MSEPALSLVPQPDPFRKEGLGYVFEPADLRVRLRVDYLRERGDDFTGEIVVENLGAGAHIHQARFNLVSTTTRAALAKHLAATTRDTDLAGVPWADLVETLSVSVLRHERRGAPFLASNEIQPRPRARDLIQRLLPAGKVSMWYGPQGTGKGWLVMGAMVAASTGLPLAGWATDTTRALYLDWEDDEWTFRERLEAVAMGYALDGLIDSTPIVHYRHMRGPLARQLHTVLRFVDEQRIGLVVIDSVGLAAGATDDTGDYARVALQFFDVLSYLSPATVLLVDHITGANQKEALAGKAFGSIYKMAEVRCAWEIRKEQEAGAEEQVVALYHTKHNHTPKYPAIGIRYEFSPTQDGEAPQWVSFGKADVRDSMELAKGLTKSERILAVLRRGPLDIVAICDLTDIKDNEVRAYLSRHQRNDLVVKVNGAWALRERGATPRNKSVAPLRAVDREPSDAF